MNTLLDWLRQKLGMTAYAFQLVELRNRVSVMEQWVRNIDAALGQHVDQDAARAAPDYKQLAGEIRERMMAVKQVFPTSMGDIK